MAAKKTPQKSRKNQKLHHWVWREHPKLWRVLGWVFGVLAFLALAVYVAFQVSPWPNALLIRDAFDKQDAKVAQALEKHVPAGISEVRNQAYRQGDPDASLNVFYPEGTTSQLPTIVWVHGGAWVSGGKDDIDNYLKILASHGFTTVSVNYSLAPEKQYPTPIVQLNDALEYIQRNAQRLHIDDAKIVMAGDSAGSQIVAQTANLITSSDYANEIGIQPKLEASKLKGLLLNCGAYDLNLPNYNGQFGSFLHTVLWAYSGTKDFLKDPRLKTASVVNYITPQFPPSFVTAGNVDPLLEQSTEFAKKLQSLGVKTSTLFYETDHQPELNHEYQFNLDNPDGQKALQQMVNFAKQQVE